MVRRHVQGSLLKRNSQENAPVKTDGWEGPPGAPAPLSCLECSRWPSRASFHGRPRRKPPLTGNTEPASLKRVRQRIDLEKLICPQMPCPRTDGSSWPRQGVGIQQTDPSEAPGRVHQQGQCAPPTRPGHTSPQ